MNDKASVRSASKVIEEALNTEFIIPESNFWRIFNSYKKGRKVKIIKGNLKNNRFTK